MHSSAYHDTLRLNCETIMFTRPERMKLVVVIVFGMNESTDCWVLLRTIAISPNTGLDTPFPFMPSILTNGPREVTAPGVRSQVVSWKPTAIVRSAVPATRQGSAQFPGGLKENCTRREAVPQPAHPVITFT